MHTSHFPLSLSGVPGTTHPPSPGWKTGSDLFCVFARENSNPLLYHSAWDHVHEQRGGHLRLVSGLLVAHRVAVL